MPWTIWSDCQAEQHATTYANADANVDAESDIVKDVDVDAYVDMSGEVEVYVNLYKHGYDMCVRMTERTRVNNVGRCVYVDMSVGINVDTSINKYVYVEVHAYI